MKMRAVFAAGCAALVTLLPQGSIAADLKLLSATGMRAALDEILPQFERATGHKTTVQYGSSNGLKRQVEAGAAFDLTILTSPVFEDLARQGKVAGATRATIARSGMGVAVRAGAPKPEISSVDAFKRVLLDAKSVAYAPDGVIGAHMTSVFERLRIGGEMSAKTKPQQTAERTVQAVADGEADLGFAGIVSILTTRGAELLGPFPLELQDYVVYVAGVGAAATSSDGAKALIAFLKKSAAASTLKAKGLEPAAP